MAEQNQDLQVVIQSKDWTPAQQLQELTRRLEILGFGKEVLPAFIPRSDDVICVVPYKCGTTWLTHICHQIRMQGTEPDFEDQTKVVCWLEWNKKLHESDTTEFTQPAEPRLYVTRFTDYHVVPKSSRMIFLFRDQTDALYSMYRMMDSSLVLKGRVSPSIFARAIIDKGDIRKRFEDLVVWWEKRHHENVLLLFYDDLKEDHAGSVRRIAKFMGANCDDDVIVRVVDTTTHAEMSKHSFRFDFPIFTHALAKKLGEESVYGTTDYVGRIRKDGGKSGDGKVLSADVKESIEELWSEIVTANLGFKNMQEMRKQWLKEIH